MTIRQPDLYCRRCGWAGYGVNLAPSDSEYDRLCPSCVREEREERIKAEEARKRKKVAHEQAP